MNYDTRADPFRKAWINPKNSGEIANVRINDK